MFLLEKVITMWLRGVVTEFNKNKKINVLVLRIIDVGNAKKNKDSDSVLSNCKSCSKQKEVAGCEYPLDVNFSGTILSDEPEKSSLKPFFSEHTPLDQTIFAL